MTVSPHLRDPTVEEHRVSALELFFDLVFVFAITQLSHLLIRHPDAQGFAQTTFLLLVVWWAWCYTTWMTNWFDPASRAVKLLLIALMSCGLVMSISLPKAFGEHALLFASSYVVFQVSRNAFNVWAVHDGTEQHRSFLRILGWSIASGVLWIAGAAAGGELLVALWIAALVVDYAGPLVRYWTPVLGASRVTDWNINAAHFAERFQLLIIIALGESIVVTGATAVSHGLHTTSIGAALLALGITAAMWWLYFNFVAARSLERLRTADNAGKLARDAFTYLHLPIVMGIILAAVADELLIAHPGDPFEQPVIAIAGPVLYLLGHNLFRLSMARSISMNRLVAMFALVMLLPAAERLSAMTTSALVLAVLVALIVREETFTAPPLPSSQGDPA